MRVLRKFWIKFHFIGCIICVVAAILIFRNEVCPGNAESPRALREREGGSPESPNEDEDPIYETSGEEDLIVSHSMNELEKITSKMTSKDHNQIELVECHLRLWFRTYRRTVMTRTAQNFAEDEAHPYRSAHGTGGIVFLCLNFTDKQ